MACSASNAKRSMVIVLPGNHVFAEKGISGRQVGYVRRKMLGFHNGGLRFNGDLGVSGYLNNSFFLDSLVS